MPSPFIAHSCSRTIKALLQAQHAFALQAGACTESVNGSKIRQSVKSSSEVTASMTES
jgi:hypothetical protein